MQLAALVAYFETSPTLRLLRSSNAPFIAEFLDRQFKRPGRIVLPQNELHASLVAYLEDIHSAHADALRDRPEAYLAAWCSAESPWLHRFLEGGSDEPRFQLTPHAEDVFALLDRALEQNLGLVGTESRLRLVLATLGDLIVGASGDPTVRLGRLRAEQARLADEIRRLEAGEEAPRYQPAQVRERFGMAVSLLKQLQGDFRAVEEHFREITRQVRRRLHEGRDPLGGILEYALDAEEVLKQQDQGVTFHEFVRFILSPEQQERHETLLVQLADIPELAEQSEGLEALRRMVPQLLAEAEKVMRTTGRLSTALRRLLDSRGRRDRQRVTQLCAEILALAETLPPDTPREELGAEVETRPALAAPWERTFWRESPRFTAIDLTEHAADGERRAQAFRHLTGLRRLDWRSMRDRVKSMVTHHGTVSLGRLLAEHPPVAGAVEVLGYLQIAHDDGHLISPAAEEEIVLPPLEGESPVVLTVPLVRFVAK